MFCPNCGKELKDGMAFCVYCGAPIEVGGSTTNSEKAQPQPAPPATQESEPEKQEPAAQTQARQEPAAQTPAKPEPAAADGGQKTSFVQSTPFRIIMLALGVCLIGIGIFRILQGTGVIGGKPAEQAPQQQTSQQQAPQQQTTDQQQTSTKPDETQTNTSDGSNASSKVDESKAKTSKGFVTLYGCAELDGAQLQKIFKEYEYDQITDEGATYMVPSGSYALVVRSGPNKEYIGVKDIAKLKAGGEGTPVMYKIIVKGYKTPAEALKEVGNLKPEKSETLQNGLEVGTYKNTAGKRYLYVAQAEKNDTIGLMLYNEDGLAAGYQSSFGKTVDEVYNAVCSAGAKKDSAGANEVSIDEMNPVK